MTGYADAEWTLAQTNDPADGYHNFFNNQHFNLIANAWIVDNVFASSEVEYENSGDEINFEFGYLAFTGIKNLRIAAGKFIIPFNRFNADLHPTWIQKMQGRPLVDNVVFPATYSDVGIWATGASPIGSNGSRVTYDFYVVNGLKGAADEPNVRNLRGNLLDAPRDDNKAVGGRLGIVLPMGLDFALSGYSGRYTDSLQISFIGGDFAYHGDGGNLEIRGEAAYGRQNLSTGGKLERTGFYVQAAYALGRFSPALQNFEPVVRYSLANLPGDAQDVQEVGVGVNYYVSPSSSIRVGWFNEHEDAPFQTANNKFMTQFNVVF